jgi:DNA-binding transcriptional LysR family regulator
MTSTLALRDLNKLNTFVRVAECASFTSAARQLHTTPSALSKHVSELENALGFSLLNRSTHGVSLTDAGEGLLNSCRQMFAQIDDYVVGTRNIHAGPFGSLRIQASAGYAHWILAPLISEFMQRYPKLRVQLIAERSPHTPNDDRCDLIFTSKRPAGPGLVGTDIGLIQEVICASPAYFREHGMPNEPQQLRNHNCLVNSLFAPREWAFRTETGEVSVEVKGTFSSNSSAALTRVALDGIGIVRVPRHTIVSELAGGRLVPIFEAITVSRDQMRAYYSKTRHLPAKITSFIEFLRTSLAAW